MPRSDSAGSSRNRRGAGRSNSSRKSFDDKGKSPDSRKKFSRGKPGGASGFKSSGSEKPPYRKSGDSAPSDSREGKFSRGKSQDNRSFGEKKFKSEKPSFDRRENPKSSRDKKFSRNKPDQERGSRFGKFKSEKPTFRRGDDSSEGKRNFSGGPRGRSKPFSSSKSDKPTFRRGDDSSEGKRSFSGPRDKSKPFSSSKTDKPTFRRGDETSGDKRNFSEGPRGRSKPFSSSEKPSYRKKEDRHEDKRGFSEKRKEKSRPVSKGYDEPTVQSEKIRLNKFIANSGVCSRREADELITMGLISVNGKTITELGYKINPGDEVRHENKVLRSEKLVYILMNKPKGYLTTTSDPQERNTVMHIIGNAVKERIYPVGRLDRNTTGLLLLTNDGDLADKLMHPSYNAKKIYKAELDRPFAKADLDRILEGVQLEEGKALVDDAAIVSEDRKTVGIEIHIGWNRVIRRIFEALEYEVVKLDRSVYAGLDKKDLPRGHWRPLTREEVIRLKHFNKSAAFKG